MKRFLNKKVTKIIFSVVIILLVARLLLPYFVLKYVNKVLADIPGYYGQVDDIDISLIRGAYVVKGLYLNLVDAQEQVPFLNFPETDISVEWKSLFNGEIVSEVIMQGAVINYVSENQSNSTAKDSANADDWTDALTDLIPLKINHLEIHDGKISYQEVTTDPAIDLEIYNLELTIDNLRNVVAKKNTLPSPLSIRGTSMGNGNFKMDGHLNILKEIPDMDISLALEQADVTSLNPLTDHYAKLDFERGTFGVYSEIAIADSKLKGYIKPLLENTKFIGETDKFPGVIWEGFADFLNYILKNKNTKKTAVKVPFEGNLDNVDVGAWQTFLSIFRNAWVEAFKSAVDNEIDYSDALEAKE